MSFFFLGADFLPTEVDKAKPIGYALLTLFKRKKNE
jgi:hypothetical protein